MAGILEKFVMEYVDGLSNPVYLKLPSGSEWKIELRRWDGEGSPKFYSLDLGHWLVFGYEGNSKFRVCIFDGSCTDVYYPLTMPQMEETQCDDDSHDGFRDVSFEDSDENSVEMFNFPPCQRKTREKSTLSCPWPHKKYRRVQVWLPSKFHKLHPINHSCEVILQVLNGRTWSVDLNCGKDVFFQKKVVEAHLAREHTKNKHLEDASID
ncbi:hypothetical protein Prudu_019884 [Prunus dulcis]|uniref:Uncharacterized protein n=1 Tax=Prunus dulcis TaxID=3755 RepID=A0A4Y1RU10_PRUDU|nr:hypothetical protein Prudu_019884 [Prunus dulcis]